MSPIIAFDSWDGERWTTHTTVRVDGDIRHDYTTLYVPDNQVSGVDQSLLPHHVEVTADKKGRVYTRSGTEMEVAAVGFTLEIVLSLALLRAVQED